MSNVKWNQGFGNNLPGEGQLGSSYVLDIVTDAGDTQMNLYTFYPDTGFDALTAASADDTAAALQSAVNALSAVTSSVLTPLSVQGPPGTVNTSAPITVLYDAAAYACWLFAVTLPTEYSEYGDSSDGASLITASPADGALSAADLATVTAALVTFMESLPTVTACTVTQQSVVPGTV